MQVIRHHVDRNYTTVCFPPYTCLVPGRTEFLGISVAQIRHRFDYTTPLNVKCMSFNMTYQKKQILYNDVL